MNKTKPWGASYDQGRRLVDLGLEFPYLDSLPGRKCAHQCALYVRQLDEGYFESLAIDRPGSTDFAIALRVGTDLSSAIVSSFRVELPWPGYEEIEWGSAAEDVLPKSRLHDYGKLITTAQLSDVLMERKSLCRGRPVDGLLCGHSSVPIPTYASRQGPTEAKIIVVDDSGGRVCSPIVLWIDDVEKRQIEDMRKRASSRKLQTTEESG